MQPPWLIGQFAVTAALAGLCWTVQLAVYPLFARVLAAGGAEGFRDYHAAYTGRMGWVAAPLMLAELALAGAWLWLEPASPAARGGAALVVAVWINTFAVMVPLHARLQAAPDARLAGRLTAWNGFRTLAWTARAVVLGCALR